MIELWLIFEDEKGEIKRVLVEPEKFAIGRHSDNDLSIANSKLSREHVKIDRFGDVFVVSDCNSSNGTILNGEKLSDPVALKNEDILNLGGGLNIEIELVSDDPNVNGNNAGGADPAKDAEESSAGNAVPSAGASVSSNGSSIPTGIFWIAPAFGLMVLVLIGGLFLAFSGKQEREIGQTGNGFVYSSERTSAMDEEADEKPTPKPTQKTEKTADNLTTTKTTEDESPPPTPQISSEREKIGQNASSFMRRIAFNDPKPFLTDPQTETVNSKISQLKGSAALAENLKLIKKNSAQFESLASSKNLKPQFLAIAALTKLGNTRGDPVAVAQAMLPVLGDLKGTLDNKLADDNLLIIAGYARNQAGGGTPLQNVLEGLSKSSQTENITPREIRTIWFLKKKDKISDAEFNFALQFLAIGTISQNPKDFNVNAEAVTF